MSVSLSISTLAVDVSVYIRKPQSICQEWSVSTEGIFPSSLATVLQYCRDSTWRKTEFVNFRNPIHVHMPVAL